MASEGDFYDQTLQREQYCSQRSTEVLLKWFAGTSIGLGATTYMAHQFYAPFRRVNWRFKFIPVMMASLGAGAYKSDVELTECRREMHRISFESDRKRRSAEYAARKAAQASQLAGAQQSATTQQ